MVEIDTEHQVPIGPPDVVAAVITRVLSELYGGCRAVDVEAFPIHWRGARLRGVRQSPSLGL